jgi:hypothetical protein
MIYKNKKSEINKMSSEINMSDMIEQEKSLNMDNVLKQIETCIYENNQLKKELLKSQNELKEYKRICKDLIKR